MTAVLAIFLVAGMLAAPMPFFLTGLPWPMAAAASLVCGVLLGALGGFLVGSIGLPATATAAAWAMFCWALSLMLARKFPLPPRNRPRLESLAGRITGYSILGMLGALFLIYLWANAVHPPILAETLFKWSGPARGLGPVFGLPLRFSAYYYSLAHTDLGWKFIWSALSFLPVFVIGASLHTQARGISAVSGAMLAPSLSFSFLFWGSTGQPDLFLTGAAILLWWSALTPWAARSALLWLAAAVLAWSGGFWAVLAAPALLVSALRKDSANMPRASQAAAAALLLGKWAMQISPDWRLWNDIIAYFARDAWNIARYGPLTYLSAAFFLRTVRFDRSSAYVAFATLSTLALFVIELSSREATSQAVLLHVAGNRLFTCVLVLLWFVAVYEGGRGAHSIVGENKPASSDTGARV